MGAAEVEQFLTYLAVNGRVAASTQNQAKCALLFLYKEVLAIELSWLDNVEQAKMPKCLPVVLNRAGSGGFIAVDRYALADCELVIWYGDADLTKAARLRCILFAIRLRPICRKAVTIFARCRSCWVMQMSVRR
jgi:glutathione S-transferase